MPANGREHVCPRQIMSLESDSLNPVCAVVIPVGAGTLAFNMLRKLIMSIVRHEPMVKWIVLVDDSSSNRRLEMQCLGISGCDVVSIENPRHGQGVAHLGGLFVGVMHGLEWVFRQTNAAYAIKLDTDSLVIRPFSSIISDAFFLNSQLGQVGVIGRTCDRSDPTFGFEAKALSPLVLMARRWEKLVDRARGDIDQLTRIIEADERLQWCKGFRHVYDRTRAAEDCGYRTLAYCQGGAYALSKSLLSRLSEAGCFEEAIRWSTVPVGEDVIMGMHTICAGLQMRDLSLDGSPFGLRWRGLPFSPPVLIEKRFSIIHSVKGDPSFSADDIYSFYGF